MPQIMVWPEIILDIALWVKSKMASISARLSYKLTFSTEWTQKHNFGVCHVGFSGMPDIVECFESTFDIELWIKSKMATICENQIYNCQQNGSRFVILVTTI